MFDDAAWRLATRLVDIPWGGIAAVDAAAGT